MGYFRFRRSVKILPGIRLNIGKRGVSTSIGVRGAHVTFGRTGTRTAVGLPGSGLSYTHLEKPHQGATIVPGKAQPATVTEPLPKGRAWRGWLWIALALAIGLVLVRNGHAEATSRCGTNAETNGHPEVWGFIGVVVGGLLTGGVDFIRRRWERQIKARELRLARGEEILLQLEAVLEWYERARKVAFEGNIYVPLHIPVFRVAAIVEVYFPSLSDRARAVNEAASALRQIMVDLAASRMQQMPMSGQLRLTFETLSARFPPTVVEMITETRKVVRGIADEAAPTT
jgi:hypothetical protein